MNTNLAADFDQAARTDVRPRLQRAASRAPDGWRVREFQDEGIDHVEVRDGTGRVRITIAYAAGVYWTLHVGFPSARVSLPNWRLKLPDGANPTVIYAGASFSLIRFNEGDDAVWCIQPA